MDGMAFLKTVKKAVQNYHNEKAAEQGGTAITENDVYIVWACKILQHNKELAATRLPDDMYYEVTYNGDKKECYLDAYKKEKNVVFYGSGDWEKINAKNPHDGKVNEPISFF